MSKQWSLTVDCARPRKLAAFWCHALGYVLADLHRSSIEYDDHLADLRDKPIHEFRSRQRRSWT
ncbi:VOC family protein [Micromonospora chersina]|uniref:VOC family protein n=1 Tax=Micromonospora chersina TaxID=47854 RepID=UPI0036A67F08